MRIIAFDRFSRRGKILIASIVALLFLFGISPHIFSSFFATESALLRSMQVSSASAECYMDTPSGYRGMGGGGRIGPYPDSSSCEAVNSQYFGGRGRCSCTSVGGSSGGGSGGGYSWRKMQEERELQEELLRQQREEEERRRKQQLLEQAEEEARQREDIRQRAFDEGKREAVDSLKGSGGDIKLKDVVPFGIQGNPKNPGIELKGPAPDLRAITTEWRQAHCGMWIAGFAIPAGKKGDVEEVHYLRSQALKTFWGGTPELQCPETPPPPDVVGREITGKDSPLVKFHEVMLRATEKEAGRIAGAEKQILEAGIKRKKIDAEIKVKEKEIEKLESEVKQVIPPQPVAPQAPQKAEPDRVKDDALDKKKRALAEAMEALRKAQDAAKEVDALLASAEKEKTDAGAILGKLGDMSQKVQASPDSAADMTKALEK